LTSATHPLSTFPACLRLHICHATNAEADPPLTPHPSLTAHASLTTLPSLYTPHLESPSTSPCFPPTSHATRHAPRTTHHAPRTTHHTPHVTHNTPTPRTTRHTPHTNTTPLHPTLTPHPYTRPSPHSEQWAQRVAGRRCLFHDSCVRVEGCTIGAWPLVV